MNEPKTCLVTGATGAVGPALVCLLVEQGYQVRVLIRPGTNTGPLPDGISYIIGDISDPQSVQEAVSGVDVVFHLAAKLHINDPQPHLEEEFFRVNVLGTQNIVEAAAAQNIAQFIFISTINVYHPSPNGEVRTEKSDLGPDTIYARTKVEAEKVVLAARREMDRAPFCTILRSAAVYGPNMKGNYARVVKGVSSGWFMPVSKCENRRTLITDQDLAKAAILVAENPDAISKIYNVTDGKIYTLDEIYRAIWRSLGKPPPRFRIPFFPVRIAVLCMEMLFKLFDKMPPITLNTLNVMVEDRAVDGTKIQEELNFEPSLSLQEGWDLAVKGILGK